MRYHFCPVCGGPLHQTKEMKHPSCERCSNIFYQNPIVGVAAIVLKEKRILLGKRNISYKDTWCIPCGYVEYDEEIREAAKREFLEETGLIIDVGPVYDVHSNFHNPKQHTVGVWFLADTIGGILQANDDISELAYFSYDQLPVLAFETDRLVLEKLKREQHLE